MIINALYPMNQKYIVAVLLLFILPGMGMAQKKRKTGRKPAVEVPAEDPRVTKMIEATQQVVIIDSVVVPKASFLNCYMMDSEAGSLVSYKNFFHSDEYPFSMVYVNELGNKCYYAQGGQFYTSDYLGGEWSSPEMQNGLEGFDQANYPFMMADGTTFYFAATGSESIGGLDIYRTRYDSEEGRFLKAENIGMPFNSEANDYMYVVDENYGIGYFATDRRQPQDSVCIYTFIPTESRKLYDTDVIDNQRLRSFARIDRIADTWGNGSEKSAALKRLEQLKSRLSANGKQKKHTVSFVVNDNIVYHHVTDFRNPDNKARFTELLLMRERYQKLSETLEKSRRYYAMANSSERKQLSSEIQKNELLQLSLQKDIRQLEKDIRRAEISTLIP